MAASSVTATATTLTLTGASMLNGNDEGLVHTLKLTAVNNQFISNNHTLYYNGDRVELVDDSGSAITSEYIVNTVGAADKITTATTITEDKVYKGIELADATEKLLSIPGLQQV